jgi:hypothetical protein
MTTLIAWAAIDQNNTSAVYIASDSRFTWGEQGVWNAGRKIFASENYPEILGYTGDALFCSQVLSQVIAFIDSCAPLENVGDFSIKYDRIESLIKRAFSSYPQRFCLPTFSIVYLTRITTQWGACMFSWNAGKGWSDKVVHKVPMTWADVAQAGQDENSRRRKVIFVSEGSGGAKFREFYSASEWSKKLPLLSRGIFGAFCDFIETNRDPLTGGNPQLSGLYRRFKAQKIGFVEGESRYLYGIAISPEDYQGNVRWVNRTFENCGVLTGEIIPREQRQPAPYIKKHI